MHATLAGGTRAIHDLDDRSVLRLYTKTRDPDAFAVLASRYQAMVLATCRRALGNEADAQDATQETFLKLARHGRDLPPGTHLRRWLFTVARNLFIDQRRRALLDVDRLRELRLWPSRPRRVEDH